MDYEDIVREAWIDDNDHMNLAYYVLVFTDALEVLRTEMGLGPALRLTQMHTLYEREVKRGDRLRVVTQVIGVEAHGLHLFQTMFHAGEGYRAASFESVARFDRELPPPLRERLASLIPQVRPDNAGRRIAMPVR